MKQVRCNGPGCESRWFSAELKTCPSCGHERPRWNKWLRTAQLNGHLNSLKAHAEAERAAA